MKAQKDSRLPRGSSDPISFTCTCPASSGPGGGLILLFYRYFAALPSLSATLGSQIIDPSELADFHRQLCQRLHLGGKIRIAEEGFNITVGGTSDEIEAYMTECTSHWSFSGLDIDTEEKKRLFFKPATGGCACAFGGIPASIRVTAEITPMGVTNYVPENWDIIESLEPAEFHERCWRDERKVLVDVRNHYESRIGYFVDPRTGDKAITPGIRRFSQWPQYVRANMRTLESQDGTGGRQIMTYCTGGIRCEKGVRFMAENMETRSGDRISTLKGGIASYLNWMDEEVKHGRKRPEESLFQGKNYVFDARGSTGLAEGAHLPPIASCDSCGVPSDRLSKCRSKGCHLVMIVCPACEDSKDPRCCRDCRELDLELTDSGINDQPRAICECERQRETALWGTNTVKFKKVQGWKSKKMRQNGITDVSIRISPID